MPFFFHRVFSYRPAKPRNPLLKVLLGVVGLALLAVLLVFGLVIGLGMLLFAAARRLMRPTVVPARAEEGVIEGEYTLVRKNGTPLHLR